MFAQSQTCLQSRNVFVPQIGTVDKNHNEKNVT